jgi:hypothetical protein
MTPDLVCVNDTVMEWCVGTRPGGSVRGNQTRMNRVGERNREGLCGGTKPGGTGFTRSEFAAMI